MALQCSIDIATISGSVTLQFCSGSSIVFMGGNGSGKTRLGVLLDRELPKRGVEVHRIAAHRSLALNPTVVPPSYEIATQRLLYGIERGDSNQKQWRRFQNKPETTLLNDFDHLMSALYAENNEVSVGYRQAVRSTPDVPIYAPAAKIDELKVIWETLLPHRRLSVRAGNLQTMTPAGGEYSASDMSDGERVIFYLIAQSLLAKPDTILIIDEPELHINRSIVAKLWDKIESTRSDCCFLYITHDVDFGSSRRGAAKYALRGFQRAPDEAWDIELVSNENDIPEDVVAMIVGSRRPILFVEGGGGSLDSALYRRVYDQFTVVPVGSCGQVIRAVDAFASRPQLHRVGCAGLIDADGRNDHESATLAKKGIYCLPVSEVENLLLLPSVFLAIADALKFSEAESNARFADLRSLVFKQAAQQIDAVCLRYTKRRLDAEMKKLEWSGTDIETLHATFLQSASAVNPKAIFFDAKSDLDAAIESGDYEKVLSRFDNKGLLTQAAKQLELQVKPFEEFIGRALRSDDKLKLHSALQACLPAVRPRP